MAHDHEIEGVGESFVKAIKRVDAERARGEAIARVRQRLGAWAGGTAGPYGVEFIGLKSDIRALLDSYAAAMLLNEQYQAERETLRPMVQALRDLTGSTQELSRFVEEIIRKGRL